MEGSFVRTMSRLVRSEVSIASSSDNTGFINYSHKNLFLPEASRLQQTHLNCIYFIQQLLFCLNK